MRETLAKIRKPKAITSKSKSIRNSVLIFVLGVVLGIIAKFLDNLALDSTIWWHNIVESLNLGVVLSEFAIWLLMALIISVFSYTPLKAAVNTFLFFAGMCVAYHVYTLIFSGFDPTGYMMIWYAITIVSPVLAVICWYGKGKGVVSIVIDCLILAVMAACCFSVGMFYFYPNGLLNALMFVASVIVLYSSPKQIGIAVVVGIILSMFIRPYLPIG